MGIFDKMSHGWELAMSSFKVLNANKKLIIFPVLSGISMSLIFISFSAILFSGAQWNINNIHFTRGAAYFLLFLFYIVNYFIVVFFNMALMYCAQLHFDGQEVTISKGLKFSTSRIHIIFSWAVFSATVGVILNMIQENFGWIGKIISAGAGLVWSVATFLVVPVLAYENLGPVEAVKRSTQLMKAKWGEGVGASFSFGLIFFFAFFILAIVAYGIGYYTTDGVGIALFVFGLLSMFTISSALQGIFISALYNTINGKPNAHFSQQLLDESFQ